MVVFIAITGTANHYVLDAVAGGLVIAIGFIAVGADGRPRARADRRARPALAPLSRGPAQALEPPGPRPRMMSARSGYGG